MVRRKLELKTEYSRRGKSPAAAELLLWENSDGVYEGRDLIWEVLRYCCHVYEFLKLPLLVVASENKELHPLQIRVSKII